MPASPVRDDEPSFRAMPRLLVLEDDLRLAGSLKEQLERAGFATVIVTTNVGAARELVASGAVDEAILDLDVASGCACEVAAMLEQRGIPFVFLTGDKTEIDARWRGHPQIQKPLVYGQLLSFVQGALGDGGGQAARAVPQRPM